MFRTSGLKVFLLYPLNIEKMLQEIWGKVWGFLECFYLGFHCFAWKVCPQHSEGPRNLCQKPICILSPCQIREPCGSIDTIEINNFLGVNSPCCLSLSIALWTREKTWDTSMWLSWPFSLITFGGEDALPHSLWND